MPLIDSAGACVPTALCLALDWDLATRLPDMQKLVGWRNGRGTEPEGMVRALKKLGWHARLSFGNTLETCISFINVHPISLVFVLYWDWEGVGSEGHCAQFIKLDDNGNVITRNPDYPDVVKWILPRALFEEHWYDRRIDPPHEYLNRPAVFAYRK